jgi:hypothetical protein
VLFLAFSGFSANKLYFKMNVKKFYMHPHAENSGLQNLRSL